MKEDIKPMWEDEKNKLGGCFSYKVSNKHIEKTWCNLSYCLVGDDLCEDAKVKNLINGITISPKKNFCIVKIWFSDCINQNADCIDYFKGVDAHGCLFKRHFNR